MHERLNDDHFRTIRREQPARIPAAVQVLPSAMVRHREALRAIARRYPDLFAARVLAGDFDAVGGTYAEGRHVDAWGCVWSNAHHGQEAIVTGHPVPRREDVHALRPPEVDAGLPHGFLFLRLADLRGFEEIMVDFAEEPPELQMLIDVVHGYNLRQLERLLHGRRAGEVFCFGDDQGMQHALPIRPATWRRHLKPCFAELFARCRQAGQVVYMHSDGCIHEIIPDFIEIGVSVLNPQFRANGLDNLVRTCKGRVCVELDLDRQLFPFAAPGQIDRHVADAVDALGDPAGGLMLQAEVDDGVPLEAVEAICRALVRHRERFTD